MKKLLIAASMLAASVSAAEAGCSKAGLNGFWFLAVGPEAVQVIMNNGVVFLDDDKITINTFGSNCRGTGTYYDDSVPATYPLTIAAEASAGTSAAKPLQLDIGFDVAGTFNTYRMFRQ
jgi:hypothetical protein